MITRMDSGGLAGNLISVLVAVAIACEYQSFEKPSTAGSVGITSSLYEPHLKRQIGASGSRTSSVHPRERSSLASS